MVMKKLDKRLLRMIKQSKGQFISITVIVAVALCIYIMFSVTSINLQNAVDSYYKITNISDLTAEVVRIPQGALEDLKSIHGITEVQGRVSFDVPLEVSDKDEKVNIRILSLPDGGGTVNKLYGLEGTAARSDDENSVILLKQFAEARNIKVGDIITPRINGRLHNLKVCAIASSSEFIYLMENEQSLMPVPEKFGIVYASEAFSQSIFGYRGYYNEVMIKTDGQSKIDDIIDLVEKKLDKYGVKKITKLEDQLSNDVLVQELDGIKMMSSILPVMFLMVAAIIISIMLSRIVNNDRIAIGILKALGYGNLGILSHYTKYALLIGLSGSLLGITGGMLLAIPMSKVYVYYFNIPLFGVKIQYNYIIYSIILTSLFCIASGLFGARGVLHILPADSMRPEAPKAGKRILIERITVLWRHVPFSWKMIIRNIMRNKRRFAFLVLGLALAYAINIVPLYMGDAMISMFELQYGEYQKMDYTIQFKKPLNERVIVDIKHLADIKQIEPRIEYPFELINGWKKKTVNIIGVPLNTDFHVFMDRNNAMIQLPEKGILITEAIAKELDAERGDIITVKSFIPGKEDVELHVTNIFKQYLGANAYMNIEAMDELFLDKQLITGVSVVSENDLKEELKDIKNISSVLSIIDMKDVFVDFLDTINIAIGFYILFGGILSFALIYNATIIGISERMTEFASLRIMGFDKRDVYRMISKENFIIAGIAVIAGIPFGAAMIRGMIEFFSSDMMTLPVMYPVKVFILAAVATMLFVAVAQLATLKKIYKINFIDALKSRIS
jgi:putative ABC transport system permease protein